MNSIAKTLVFWLVVVGSATVLWQIVRSGTGAQARPQDISYSRFMEEVADGQVAKVTITGNEAQGRDKKGENFRVIIPADKSQVMAAMQQHGVEIWFKDGANQSSANWLLNLAPLLLLASLWFFMIRRMRRPSVAQQNTPGTSVPPNTPTSFGG